MYAAGLHDETAADGTVTNNVNGIKSITLNWYAKDARPKPWPAAPTSPRTTP